MRHMTIPAASLLLLLRPLTLLRVWGHSPSKYASSSVLSSAGALTACAQTIFDRRQWKVHHSHTRAVNMTAAMNDAVLRNDANCNTVVEVRVPDYSDSLWPDMPPRKRSRTLVNLWTGKRRSTCGQQLVGC